MSVPSHFSLSSLTQRLKPCKCDVIYVRRARTDLEHETTHGPETHQTVKVKGSQRSLYCTKTKLVEELLKHAGQVGGGQYALHTEPEEIKTQCIQ